MTIPDRVLYGHWGQTQVHLLCPAWKKKEPEIRDASLGEAGTVWGYCLHTATQTGLAHVTGSGRQCNTSYTLILLCMALNAELGSIQMLVLKQQESYFNTPKKPGVWSIPNGCPL